MDALQNKNILLLGQALLVRPQSGISGGPDLSNWSVAGYSQRQLHNTEVQTECRLYTAIDDHGFLLTDFKEDSIKLEKMVKRLVRLIEGTEHLFSFGKMTAGKGFDRGL